MTANPSETSRRTSRAVAFGALTLCLLTAGRASAAAEIGQPAPAVVFHSAEGREYPIDREWRRRPVLLAFVSPYCDPCHQDLSSSRGPEPGGRLGVVYAVLGPLRGTPAGLLDRPTLVTAGEEEAEAYGVLDTPAYFLLGRNGTVLWKHRGPLGRGEAYRAMEDALEAESLASTSLQR